MKKLHINEKVACNYMPIQCSLLLFEVKGVFNVDKERWIWGEELVHAVDGT